VNDEEVQAIKEDLEAAKSQVEDLNSQLGERDARIGGIQIELTEQAVLVEDKERELVTLRQASEADQGNITTLSESLQEAITKYRASLVAANPEIPQEMIAGEAIADIDISLEEAKALVEKVASSLERRQEEEARATLLGRVPTGAPERSSPDFSSMSAREKIEYAIRKETE